MVHYPFIYLYYAWVKNEKLSFLDSLPGALAVVIGSILLAWLCLKLYDEPVRKYLTALFLKRKVLPGETPVIQEEFLTLNGLNSRNRSSPAEKEYNRRREPPVHSVPVMENPEHMSPLGPQKLKEARPHPAATTSIARERVESFRMKRA